VAARGAGTAQALSRAGFTFLEGGLSALCRYRGRGARDLPLPVNLCFSDAGQAELARLFEGVSYPGLSYADASFDADGTSYRVACDAESPAWGPSWFEQSSLRFDPLRGVFLDPRDAYPSLGREELAPTFDADAPWPMDALFEAAALVSRTPYVAPGAGPGYEGPGKGRGSAASKTAMQRDLLTLVLTGAFPWKGLALLRDSGFIESEWPEIAQLFDVEHSKEFHPEGGAWDHTLETFRYRKDPDLLLSLALLLHDSGKPLSVSTEGRRFDRHAELGSRASRALLRRLEFSESIVEGVSFLVGKHMLPSALPRLPLNRAVDALESPLFPVLLELFRCDMSSTFMGPDAYYEACAAYRRYKKNVKNPYRAADGTLPGPRKRRHPG
jgi:poly(A) polymerase